MTSDVYRFAGEMTPPVLFMSPLLDRGLGTLEGSEAYNPTTRLAISDFIKPELTDNDQIIFSDLEKERTPDVAWLLDRFEDATGGVFPGQTYAKTF